MASIVPVVLLLSVGLFAVGSSSDCLSYTNRYNAYKPLIRCGYNQHCCGTCNNRYCCYNPFDMLPELKQSLCPVFSQDSSKKGSSQPRNVISIPVTGVAVVIFIIVIISCRCCSCCCMYNMCRKPRPVAGTHITTVMNTQSSQPEPVVTGAESPAYQPVPAQPGYGGQPVQMGQYPGQPYAPGPPPSCQIVSPGYPTSQAAYDGGQATNPMLPPAQHKNAHLPPDTFNQPAYNPAYMQPPQTGY